MNKMKNLMKTAFCLLMAGALAMNFVACDKDDDNGNGTTDPEAVVFDQKEFLQNSLVRVDEKGNFMYRLLGAPIEAADTTRLYVGVENLTEAKSLFKGLFAPETNMSESGDIVTCSLKDEKGNAQGTVVFTPAATGATDGELASVSFDGCKLVAVSSLHFCQKEVLEENNGVALSPYKVGDKVRRQTLTDGDRDWICLREASGNQQGILYYMGTSVSVDTYRSYASRNSRSSSEIQQIRKLIGTEAAFWCGNFYCTSTKHYQMESSAASTVHCPILEFSYFDRLKDAKDNAQVGDYYMKDGSIVSKDANLTDAQKNNCVGIVYWKGNPAGYDAQLKKEHPECIHGLVVALQNAVGGDPFNPTEKIVWCNNLDHIGTSGSEGYSNTQKIRNYNRAHSSSPVYAVVAIDGYSDDFNQPAPSGSSGWYFPAIDELVRIYSAKGVLESQFSRLGRPRFSTNSYYWSSSEGDYRPADFARYVYFGDGYVYNRIKDVGYGVRGVFAF